MCSKGFATHDYPNRPRITFILNQLSRNNDKNIDNNNIPKKHTARLPFRPSETSILTISFSVSFQVPTLKIRLLVD